MEIKDTTFTNDIILILGPNSSGKSLFAESLAVDCGSKRLYLATMVPQTPENEVRIQKHRLQRQHKGFVTVEKDWDIDQICVDSDTVVLLEDVSNLLANGIFIHHQTTANALQQIQSLAKRCKLLIAVNIAGLDAGQYEGETAAYINGINHLNEQLSHASRFVYEMKDGVAHLR